MYNVSHDVWVWKMDVNKSVWKETQEYAKINGKSNAMEYSVTKRSEDGSDNRPIYEIT